MKCVWKSNCIWIIRNDSKKKKMRIVSSGPGSASGSGQVQRRGPSHRKCYKEEFFFFPNLFFNDNALLMFGGVHFYKAKMNSSFVVPIP